MIRRIVVIDEEKCSGCGKCAEACHENAIGMVNGKARLLRDDYCDGLGDCLPACPAGAISFVEREAVPYDEAAVRENQMRLKMLADKQTETAHNSIAAPCGCPGTAARTLKAGGKRTTVFAFGTRSERTEEESKRAEESNSCLGQWPVQIKLAPVRAAFFDDSELLIAADCTAYAFADFHERFMRGRITLIGCPKLDSVDYSEKLTEIIRNNEIKSITVARMEVPCCGGIELAVKKAAAAAGKSLPVEVFTISTRGCIL